jgi:predicted nucleic acid-binding protein
VAALVDTNILVYRFDNRFPSKKKIATEVLRRGIVEGSVRCRIKPSWLV